MIVGITGKEKIFTNISWFNVDSFCRMVDALKKNWKSYGGLIGVEKTIICMLHEEEPTSVQKLCWDYTWDNPSSLSTNANVVYRVSSDVEIEVVPEEKIVDKQSKQPKRLKIVFNVFGEKGYNQQLSMQILEQRGLPKNKNEGCVVIRDLFDFCLHPVRLFLRGDSIEKDFEILNFKASEFEIKYFIEDLIKSISGELFDGKSPILSFSENYKSVEYIYTWEKGCGCK